MNALRAILGPRVGIYQITHLGVSYIVTAPRDGLAKAYTASSIEHALAMGAVTPEEFHEHTHPIESAHADVARFIATQLGLRVCKEDGVSILSDVEYTEAFWDGFGGI